MGADNLLEYTFRFFSHHLGMIQQLFNSFGDFPSTFTNSNDFPPLIHNQTHKISQDFFSPPSRSHGTTSQINHGTLPCSSFIGTAGEQNLSFLIFNILPALTILSAFRSRLFPLLPFLISQVFSISGATWPPRVSEVLLFEVITYSQPWIALTCLIRHSRS